MSQLLLISAIGDDRTAVVYEFTRVIAECGGNVVESRLSALGADLAMLLLVSGNWHTLIKLESELKKVAEQQKIDISIRKTNVREPRKDMLPYNVDVICLDHSGIVSNLIGFFATRKIEVGEMYTRSYEAAQTGASMFAVQMTVSVPSSVQIASLREEFMDFCDQMNLDAIIEPVKG